MDRGPWTTAEVFKGVAKVGEFGGPADQKLRCAFTNDANGERRSQAFSVN